MRQRKSKQTLRQRRALREFKRSGYAGTFASRSYNED